MWNPLYLSDTQYILYMDNLKIQSFKIFYVIWYFMMTPLYIFLHTFLPQFHSIIAPPPPSIVCLLTSSSKVNFHVFTSVLWGVWFMPWCVCVQGAWKWSDGTALDYTHWQSGQPAGVTSWNCMVMNTAQTWYDNPCAILMYYVCKL